MAKLENAAVKKPKGKKRKHTNTETEDEIANKSLIVEANNAGENEAMQTNTETNQAASTKKSKKRKNGEKGEIKNKRSKPDKSENEATNDEHEANEDFHEPTLEELKECEKPENKLAIVTVRQKKKGKHEKLLEAQKGQSDEKEKYRNTEYLNKWKHARDSWKFEKLRQISIQQHIFEIDKLDENIWPIALEYLAGAKGFAKDKIVKMANEVMEEIDKQCEQQETEEEKQILYDSAKYQRARDLLQIFV